jgi:hypothetical protein
MPKKKVISMLEFLRSGNFGMLGLGASREDMLAYLGEPTDWANTTNNDFDFCKYGDVEFHWNKDTKRIFLIHMDWFSGEDQIGNRPLLSEPHILNSWLLHQGMDINAAELALEKEFIPFSKKNRMPGLDVFEFENNCEIYFDTGDEDFSGLSAISLFDKNHGIVQQ